MTNHSPRAPPKRVSVDGGRHEGFAPHTHSFASRRLIDPTGPNRPLTTKIAPRAAYGRLAQSHRKHDMHARAGGMAAIGSDLTRHWYPRTEILRQLGFNSGRQVRQRQAGGYTERNGVRSKGQHTGRLRVAKRHPTAQADKLRKSVKIG